MMLPRKLCHDDVGKTRVVDTDTIRPACRVDDGVFSSWPISDSGSPISTSSL
jgi:hypothetical protein